jgi:hypothetical protein
MGFGAHCDLSPFRGWVVGLRAADGGVAGSWATPTAEGARGGGIWLAGAGLMSDGPGRIFLATGNGFLAPGYTANVYTPTTPQPGNSAPSGLASSVVRLQVQATGTLATGDFFTPCDAATLQGTFDKNVDVSSGGTVALPSAFGSAAHRAVVLAGGKSGKIYALDRNNMGGFQQGPSRAACPAGGDAAPQVVPPAGAVWGAPAAWSGDGGWVIVPTSGKSGANDASIGTLNFYTGKVGNFTLAGVSRAIWGFGSGSPMITSVGSRRGSAIVWAVDKSLDGSALLRAYAVSVAPGAHVATPLAALPVGRYAKFTAPGVGPDSIYVGNGVGHVIGFGPRRRGTANGTLLTGLRLSRSKFRAGSRGGLTGGSGGGHAAFNLSRGDRVLVAVTRSAGGGSTVVVASSIVRGRRGSNALTVTARSAGRKLPSGAYQLALTPIDGAGDPDGITQVVAFRLVP